MPHHARAHVWPHPPHANSNTGSNAAAQANPPTVIYSPGPRLCPRTSSRPCQPPPSPSGDPCVYPACHPTRPPTPDPTRLPPPLPTTKPSTLAPMPVPLFQFATWISLGITLSIELRHHCLLGFDSRPRPACSPAQFEWCRQDRSMFTAFEGAHSYAPVVPLARRTCPASGRKQKGKRSGLTCLVFGIAGNILI